LSLQFFPPGQQGRRTLHTHPASGLSDCEGEKASASFFEKKEAKKLLLTAGRGRAVATAPKEQKFFASFF
jgi:hypothetical protein